MIPFIAGNWKMNKKIREAVQFTNELKNKIAPLDDRMVVLAPPFTALSAVADVLKGSNIHLSAQNLSDKADGAFTGEVSASMLAEAGCEYVIIGHSERRILFGETDALINGKIKMALSSGLKPIFCVGETLTEREKNQTFKVIERQIKEGLNNVCIDDIRRAIIAYEPVWAIGTGKTATPEQAQEVHVFIRLLVETAYDKDVASDIPIIYGGSVNPQNIDEIMAKGNINGVLVGGASLDVDSFLRIVRFLI
jgi:triosephosphate isomerase (TIM)